MTLSRPLIAGAFAALSVLATTTTTTIAKADDAPASDYQAKPAPGQYQAPLSQTTQPSYVPQSVALSGPTEIEAEDNQPIPPGYTPVHRMRKGPIIGGAITFGSLYLLSAMVASIGDDTSRNGGRNEVAALWIPIVGPFVQMTKTDSSTANLFLAIDGLGQSLGAGLLIYGLTSPKTVLVRNDMVGLEVHVMPIATRETQGLGLAGTF